MRPTAREWVVRDTPYIAIYFHLGGLDLYPEAV